MASLTAHLRRPDDHGRLGFHPECPVCRGERLAGREPNDAVVGGRTKALVAAGVLALSTASPGVVRAAEPDQEQEGVTAPDQTEADAPSSEMDLDPGGESTDLPLEVPQAPEIEASSDPYEDEGALEPEAAADDELPIADGNADASAPSVDPQQTPPAMEAPAAPSPAPEATSPPPAPETAATPAQPYPDAAAESHARERETARASRARNQAAATSDAKQAAHTPSRATQQGSTSPSVASYEATAASSRATAAEPSTGQPEEATASRSRTAQRSDRFHVVRPNESLWSIASDLLGDDASAARIAREVNRLWELNSERVGTGNPDLVMIGTRLTLR
jgi:hypothetical protein